MLDLRLTLYYLNCNAIRTALSYKCGAELINLKNSIGNDFFEQLMCLFSEMGSSGMGYVNSPALANADFLQRLAYILNSMSESSANRSDGKLSAIVSLGEDRGELGRLTYIGNKGRESAASTQIVKISGDKIALGGIHQRLGVLYYLIKGFARICHINCFFNEITVRTAESAAVYNDYLSIALANFGGCGSAVIGSGETFSHGNIQDVIVLIALVKLGDIADRRLAAHRHITFADYLNKILRAYLVKFAVAAAGNGNRQGRYFKSGVFGLLGGIEGRGVGNDAYHIKYS